MRKNMLTSGKMNSYQQEMKNRTLHRLVFVCLLFVFGTGTTLPAQQSSTSKGTISVTPGYEKISDQKRIPVKVTINLDEGWHIQAHEVSMEGLVPTDVRVSHPEGASVQKQIYPETVEIQLEGMGWIEVYEGTVEIAVLVELAEQPPAGEAVELTLDTEIQACVDYCLAPDSWSRSISIQRTEGEPVRTDAYGWLEEKLGKDLLQESEDGTSSTGIEEGDTKEVSNEQGDSADGEGGINFGEKVEQSLFWALVAAFFWGMGASLSPCVYPMIPLTLSYFGAQGGEEGDEEGGTDRFRVVFLALVYVLGVSLTFAALGVIVAFVGEGMGIALGNPWFVGFLVVLFVALALNMMGLFEITLPSSVQKMAGNKPGVFGAFAMGAVLGVVAAPCVGPFVAAILAFIATAGNILVGFASMFSFGLGLGMLFLVLAIFGGSFSSMMSGSGNLKHVKTFFGIVLLGVTLYFVDLWFVIMGWGETTTWLTPVLAGFTSVYFGYWLFSLCSVHKQDSPEPSLGGIAGKSLGLASLIIGLYFTLGGVVQSGFLLPMPGVWEGGQKKEKQAKIEWMHEYEKGLQAAKEQGKPLFLDFYADWCIPCKQMDRTVFSDPEVIQYVNKHFVAVKLDCTDTGSRNNKLKNEKFGSQAMPYYAFLDSSGTHLKNVSIEGKVSKEKFLDHLRQVVKRTGKEGNDGDGEK